MAYMPTMFQYLLANACQQVVKQCQSYRITFQPYIQLYSRGIVLVDENTRTVFRFC